MEIKSRGMFISFEGIDGCGKSTALHSAKHALEVLGIPVILNKEPGGTPIGLKARNIILHEQPVQLAELALFMASFAESCSRIQELLSSGTWVLTDRWTESTRAYQIGGRNLDSNLVETAIQTFCTVEPDKILLLDASVEECWNRINVRRGQSQADTIEAQGLEFQKKVYEYYNTVTKNKKQTIVVPAVNQEETAKYITETILNLQVR